MPSTMRSPVTSSLITPVIMCGGSGTRLWPVSRESLPKQFVPLVGPTSTFHQVLERGMAGARSGVTAELEEPRAGLCG